MTWAEFKKLVDDELAGRGVGQDVPVWFLKVMFPDKERLEVAYCNRHGLSVT